MHYEMMKHDGSLPIIGVNTFRNPDGDSGPTTIELARSSDEEKRSQIARLEAFKSTHATQREVMLGQLQQAAIRDENLFGVLVDAVRCCSLGEITDALFEVGGQYRRNM